MPGVRGRKAWRDLMQYPLRTLLVVLCLAVGTFAVGVVAGARAVLLREVGLAYRATAPAHAVLYTAPFGPEALAAVRAVDGVAWAEARRSASLRARAADGTWRELELVVLSDPRDVRVDRVLPWQGVWPPPERGAVLEREAARLLGVDVGGTLAVRTARGRVRALPVVGLAHDLTRPPAGLAGRAYAYVTMETLEWLGEVPAFDRVHLRVVADPEDRLAAQRVAEAARRRLERSGVRVRWVELQDPRRHPVQPILDALLLLLGVLGGLTLAAAALLATHTVHAVLVQQVRQVGVMKALGATPAQVAGIYLAMVAMVGGKAALLAVPASALGAGALAAYVARLLNVDPASLAVPPPVLAAQALVAVGVPLAAALVPVLGASRTTVREALAGPAAPPLRGEGLWERALTRVRGLPRPLLLSLRNAFRRRGRLALTVAALALAGALFVAVFAVRASLVRTLDEALDYWRYHVEVQLARPYRAEALRVEGRRVPGAVAAETWTFAAARRPVPAGGERSLLLVGVPPDTRLLRPTLLAGRWLVPGDEAALVVNSEVLRDHPDLRPGQPVELWLGDRPSRWRLVGVVRGVMAGPLAYAPYGYLARAAGSPGRATRLLVVGEDPTPEGQRRLARAVEEHLRRRGLAVRSVETLAFHRARVVRQFDVLTGFLLTMALLLALVGALGLTGTLGLNVLERTREFGVMRCLGAGEPDVRRIVLAEGWVVGGLSGVLGALLSLPLSRALADAVGYAFLEAPLSFRFAPEALALWLALAMGLATLAAWVPAWQAARLPLRDVLAYE